MDAIWIPRTVALIARGFEAWKELQGLLRENAGCPPLWSHSTAVSDKAVSTHVPFQASLVAPRGGGHGHSLNLRPPSCSPLPCFSAFLLDQKLSESPGSPRMAVPSQLGLVKAGKNTFLKTSFALISRPSSEKSCLGTAKGQEEVMQ